MRKKLLCCSLAACSVASAQYSIELKPENERTTTKVYGKGRDITIWNVSLCSLGQDKVLIQRSRIMQEFPGLSDLPNNKAREILARKAAHDPRSIIGSQGDTVLGLSSAIMTAVGFAMKAKQAQVAGLIVAGVQILLQLIKRDAPSSAAYNQDLLPSQVELDPGRCNDTDVHPYILVTEFVKKPKPLGPMVIK